jgi:hypothetical protein
LCCGLYALWPDWNEAIAGLIFHPEGNGAKKECEYGFDNSIFTEYSR